MSALLKLLHGVLKCLDFGVTDIAETVAICVKTNLLRDRPISQTAMHLLPSIDHFWDILYFCMVTSFCII